MSTQDRALASASSAASSAIRAKNLTFKADLLYPQQSQLTRYEDAVAQRIVQLDTWAQRLGEGFGISFTTFVLNPPPSNFGDTGVEMVAAVLVAFTQRIERVSLERRSGRWGLYFTREPAALSQERRTEAVPLKDAPLDVRERFLTRSEEFIREYLKLCEDRLGRMKGAVSSADATLDLLENLRLT